MLLLLTEQELNDLIETDEREELLAGPHGQSVALAAPLTARAALAACQGCPALALGLSNTQWQRSTYATLARRRRTGLLSACANASHPTAVCCDPGALPRPIGAEVADAGGG